LALGAQFLHLVVERGAVDNLDLEQHAGVVDTAQLGALAGVGADPIRCQFEDVGLAGDEVHLE